VGGQASSWPTALVGARTAEIMCKNTQLRRRLIAILRQRYLTNMKIIKLKVYIYVFYTSFQHLIIVTVSKGSSEKKSVKHTRMK
jgi:hypothetical protein